MKINRKNQKLLVVVLSFVWLSAGLTSGILQVYAGADTDLEEILEKEEGQEEFPEWRLESVMNDAGCTVTDENGMYYFREYLTLSFCVEQETSEEDEKGAELILKRNGMKVAGENGVFTDVLRESGSYVYTLEKDGGVFGETIVVSGTRACSNLELLIDYKPEPPAFDGQVYFREDPSVILCTNAEAGIGKVEYETEEGIYKVLENFQEEDHYLYGAHSVCEVVLNETDDFADVLKDMKDGRYRWNVRVTDVLGGITEEKVEFIIDKSAPDTRVFVSYDSDGSNPDVSGKTGIMELVNAFRDRLFGKTRICFELYVRDSMVSDEDGSFCSGIDMEDLAKQIESIEGNAKIENVRTEKEGLVSFEYDGVLQEDYMQIKGSMVVDSDKNGDVTDRLCVRRLKDRAGNATDALSLENITGTTILYFDSTNPLLSVNYGNAVPDPEEKIMFYGEDARIGLILQEANYSAFVDEKGEIKTPMVRIDSHGNPEGVLEGWIQEGEKIHTVLVFPAYSGEGEAEYDFTVEYQDGSGNLLETYEQCMGSTENGRYTGYTVVTDNRSPELTAFSIQGISGGQTDGTELYESVEGDDVTVSFEIDDHASYFRPEAAELMIRDQKTGEPVTVVNGRELDWSTDGRRHRANYGFDGTENAGVYCYEVVLSYEDRAGNKMMAAQGFDGKVINGIYKSQGFLLDHESPKFQISYDPAFRQVEDGRTDPSCDLMGGMLRTGYTAYYKDPVGVRFSIQESSAEPIYENGKLAGLTDFELKLSGEGGEDSCPVISWKKQEDVYEGYFTLEKEGSCRIFVSYRDLAGNQMVSYGAEGSRWEQEVSEDGEYESIRLILDQTPPKIYMSFVDRASKDRTADRVYEENGCEYFNEPVYLKLEVEDQNLRYHELLKILEKFQVSDIDGNEVEGEDLWQFLDRIDQTQIKSGIFTWYLPMMREAVYKIPAGCEDLSGNRCPDMIRRAAVDMTEPKLRLSYSVEKTSFMDAVRYRDIRYLFSDGRMTVTALAEDSVSGIGSIQCTLKEEDGAVTELQEDFVPAGRREYKVIVPVYRADFKGTMTMEAWDWSGNHTVQRVGQIIESGKKHRETGKILLETVTEPQRIINGIGYYNSDIRFRLTVRDTWSGLKSVSCRAGRTVDMHQNYDQGEHGTGEGMTYEYSKEMILEAAANNENEVLVWAEYLDNAGHREILEQRYHIDITPPVIEVEYDQNNPFGSGLYNQSRTATVAIRERNFDPTDVEFLVTNTEGCMPLIGAWETSGEGDDMLHVCRVLFSEDGDYRFSLRFTDLAGNKAAYERVDEFTIDQTAPVLNVNYDNNQSNNGNYYACGRTARIDILEHNFDASLIHVIVQKDGVLSVPSMSEWIKDGDHYISVITFDEDGDYLLSIAGTDLADNEMNSYENDYFIIDCTPPELMISGVSHQSANRGVIAPEIQCTDTNYGAEQMNILLEGCIHGKVELKGTRIRLESGERFQMEDFAYEPELDDLYRLTVSVHDLAGNENREDLMFSVNRFGSVYVLDDQTELLAGERGSYYTKKEPDIVITETNVDTLEFQEVTCSLNGKLHTMKRGEDYTVRESGTEESWKQYVYQIPKRNFEAEGIYVLTVYSEDRAANASDNHTKGKKIEFAVDKTSPSIMLSGLSDGKMYQENSKEFTLDVQDNVMTAEVQVIVNEVVSTYYASEIQKQDGRLTLHAGNAHHWQQVRIVAYDMAGNKAELDTIRFLITPNLLVQFFMNKTWFYSSVLGLLIFWAGMWHFLFRQHR